ncbi:M20 family metallopeptidase [Ornithinimicrobium sp. F0845]|uniref:M20 metallopeptidase family protein n=1 Tax=Ornithinimicrobium sp. F0845 TaxID=2926412 RepID=UPI001FF4C3F1|nr:M20 family metallopeptidase [Ornithinimicrobium sp. F0845]MCK0113081.1 M20 family metallopeptidase [Ornithinimicrobium sp. F0845]
MTMSEDARAIQEELVALRRELHQIPEVGLELPRTQEIVLRALEGLPLEVTTGTSTSSVVAVLRGGRPGPTVLLRGDMDGLPVTEATGLEYAATTGTMHACGHDLHTAGLVGAARLLCARREELCGSVVFMFQPGEEGFGGAKIMLEEGLLAASGEKPIAAYALHVFPGQPGLFEYRPGPVLAGSNRLTITVTGRGGHGSQPHTAVDPVAALLAIGASLQTMVTRRFSVFDPVVLTVTQLSAGEAVNVIPETASLGATVRTLSHESLTRVQEELNLLAEGVAGAHGCTATVDFVVQYPVTVNDDDEALWAGEQLREAFGDERVERAADPLMGSEDFSFVLDEVPGAFLFLHCSPPGVDLETAAMNHSSTVLFDDAVLADQAAALALLAQRRLERQAG